MVPAPRLLRPLARTRVDFLDRRRVPFPRQLIALWRIEPHRQIERPPWRWKPIGLPVRAGTLVLAIKTEFGHPNFQEAGFLPGMYYCLKRRRPDGVGRDFAWVDEYGRVVAAV
jgi:hypothetical protein